MIFFFCFNPSNMICLPTSSLQFEYFQKFNLIMKVFHLNLFLGVIAWFIGIDKNLYEFYHLDCM